MSVLTSRASLAVSPGASTLLVSDCRRQPQPASTLVMVSVPAPRWVSSNVWVSGAPAFTSPLAATAAAHCSEVAGGSANPTASRQMRVFMTWPDS